MKIKKNKNKIILFFIVALWINLNSCKIQQKTFDTNLTIPNKYLYSDENINKEHNLKWWELFKDPNLDSLIRIGLRNNRNLQSSIEKINQARINFHIQKVELLPKLDYQAKYGAGNFVFGQSLQSTNKNYSLLGSLSWEIDIWGKLRNLSYAEKSKFLATTFGLKTIQIALISEISNAYFTLVDYKTRLTISENTLALRDSSLHLINARYNAGIVAGIDLNQAQTQRAIAASSVPTYKRLIIQTELIINQLLSRPPQKIETLENIFHQDAEIEIPTGIPSELLKRRPDLQEAEQLILAQTANVDAKKAMLLPSLSLTSLLGLASNELSKFLENGATWSIGIDLLGPLINWKQYRNRVKIEKSKLKENILRYEQTVFTALGEVEQSLGSIMSYKEELVARESEVEATISARQLSEERYNKGVTSYLEFLETQRQAFNAELNLVQNKRELLNSYVMLYKSLGGGWIENQSLTDEG